jgi:DNA-binding MarR family transcriptional regulator
LFVRHAPANLSPRQFLVLQAVAEANGLSQTNIMLATGIDRSSTADLVARLVRHGWLSRRRLKRDSRAYAVRLTPEGRRVLAQGLRAVRAAQEVLLFSMTSAQRRHFLGALAIVAQGSGDDD